jgi:nucleoside recognition membrane protein YjiH
MWTICLALAEPIARAFAEALGRSLVDMVAAWRNDQAVAEAATASQALAASEAARSAERAMLQAADKPVSDAGLLDALDRGAV